MRIAMFNTNEKELEDKKYNIFIGISMGIKPLNEKLAKEYLEWALKHTKEKVVVLIADEIAKFNYEVISKYSKNKSYRKALKEGESYFNFFKRILEEFPKEKRNKIQILRWKDIFDEELQKMVKILENEFKINEKFREQILKFIRKYVKRRGKDVEKEKLEYLAKYILLELPTIFGGIKFEGEEYKVLFYPTFVESGMAKFVQDIWESKIFPELRKKLNIKKKNILVEAYID